MARKADIDAGRIAPPERAREPEELERGITQAREALKAGDEAAVAHLLGEDLSS